MSVPISEIARRPQTRPVSDIPTMNGYTLYYTHPPRNNQSDDKHQRNLDNQADPPPLSLIVRDTVNDSHRNMKKREILDFSFVKRDNIFSEGNPR